MRGHRRHDGFRGRLSAFEGRGGQNAARDHAREIGTERTRELKPVRQSRRATKSGGSAETMPRLGRHRSVKPVAVPDARLMPRFIVSNGSQCRRGGSTFRWHRDVR